MKLTDFPLVMFVIPNEKSQQLIDGFLGYLPLVCMVLL